MKIECYNKVKTNLWGIWGFMKKDDAINSLGRSYKGLVGETAYDNNNATIKTITKDYSNKFDTLQACFLSDMHIGSCDFDIQGLMNTLRYANSQENAVIFILGDALNTAIVGSKSDPYEDILTPQQQIDVFSEFLKIAKGNNEMAKALKELNDTGKIVVLHSGNHEERIHKAVGVSTTKLAADIAGLGDAFAPYFASTTLKLRQALAPNGKVDVQIISHHGTGISSIDGTFRLLKTVGPADMCVIGHTHQHSMKFDRTIRSDSNGNQVYHDVLCLTLPSSGGGTYGAGMALPDTAKQSAVWVAISSQPNPFAGQISPTGVGYSDFIPTFAFFTPTNSYDTTIKKRRISSAKHAIQKAIQESQSDVDQKMEDYLTAVKNQEDLVRERVARSITEKPKREPSGFEAYIRAKESQAQESIENTELEDEQEQGGKE